MNDVHRHMKARLGPPNEKLASVSLRVGVDYTSSYYREEEVRRSIIYNLTSRFLSFKCGICGETYSLEEKGGFLIVHDLQETSNYDNTLRDIYASGFISCAECLDIYQKYHAVKGTVTPLSNLFR